MESPTRGDGPGASKPPEAPAKDSLNQHPDAQKTLSSLRGVMLPTSASDQAGLVEMLQQAGAQLGVGVQPAAADGIVKQPSLQLAKQAPAAKAPAAPAAADGKPADSGSKEYTAEEHLMTLAQLKERHGTDIDVEHPKNSGGLSAEEHAARLKRNGKNVLTPPKQIPEWLKFLKQFGHLLLMLLEIAAALGFLAYGLNGDVNNLILACALIVLVTFTATLSYLQERSAGSVINSIKNMLPAQCRVVRGGKEYLAPAEDLVVGDLVHLTIGNRVPADIRIIQASDFKVEMSSLTGESDAIECGAEKRSDLPTEARNLIFNSTLVMNGECRGIVIKTGDNTMIGSIAGLASQTTAGKTTMEREVLRVVYFISALAIVTACAFFGIGMGRDLGVVNSFVNAFILVLVANVPEGLPATVTSILNLTAQTLARNNILIKRTDLIETLGSASVICSDKTGTLTQNRMTVENMWIGRTFHRARGEIHRVPTARSLTASAANSLPGSPQLRHRDPLEGMTIGRGMAFLSLPGGDALALITNTTSKAGIITPDGVTVVGAEGIKASQPSNRGVVRGGSKEGGADGATTGADRRRSTTKLASVFERPAKAAAGGAGGAASPSSGAGNPSDTPSSASGDAEAAAKAAAPAADDDEVEEDQEEEQTPVPVANPNAGAAGSDLVLTGFSGPLMDAAPIGANGFQAGPPPGTKVMVKEAVVPGLGRSGSFRSTGEGANPADVALAVADWAPGAAGSNAAADSGAVNEFRNHVSFQSFRGFTRVDWASANAFSRVCTIAAVCNRSTFSSTADGEGEGDGGDVESGAGAAGLAGPLHPWKRKESVRLFPQGVDTRTVLGDASEAALLRYVDALAPIFEWRSAYPILFEIPFNSVNKWAYCITKLPEDSAKSHLVFMKGAPERIIQRCTHHFHEGAEIPIDDAYRKEWGAAYERFGIMGERVLGFAYKIIPARDASVYKDDDQSYPLEGLVFAGLVSLVDPPKEGTDRAVATCKSAGIRVTMVTGDHPLTAEAIARKVGIITQATCREIAAEDGVEESQISLSDPRVGALVLPGYALPELSEEDWAAVISKFEVVFARTSPQQKLQIVEHYQKAGHVVAVTGDGTNDSPALKKADIGVSMGSASASDVAREAADMVIMDDNFASIVQAIEMGRVVFDNIKKTIAYTVAHLVPEVIPIFCTLAFDIPIMLSGLLILAVDCVTEQAPAISLAYEPAEASAMARPPRNLKTDRLVDFPLIFYSYAIVGVTEALVCILAFLTVFTHNDVPLSTLVYHVDNWKFDGSSPALVLDNGRVISGDDQGVYYRTAVGAYFLTLVLCQFWHIWVTKTRRMSLFQHGVFKNKVTAYGTAFTVLASIFFVYTPSVNYIFQAYHVPGYWWLPHFIFAAFIISYTEGVKYLARKEETAGTKGWVSKWLAW